MLLRNGGLTEDRTPKEPLTGTFATVTAYRRRIHRQTAARLGAAVAAYAATAPVALIRQAVDPEAPRPVRKASAGLAIASTLYASGTLPGWAAANAANRDTAWAAGAAAAAHHFSGGAVALDDAPPVPPPGPIVPTATLDQQVDGLAGDVADLYVATSDLTVTDADIAAVLDEAAGALLYGDLTTGQDFIDGSLALYGTQGVTSVDWICCPPMCGNCEAVALSGPYTIDTAPGPVHPRCWCWVESADGNMLSIGDG